jgi:acyl carrier protein
MNATEILATLNETLAQIAPEGDLGSLRPDRPLRDQLDIDSFDFLRWLIALNERLGVEIPEADYERLATLNGAVDYLAALTQKLPHP